MKFDSLYNHVFLFEQDAPAPVEETPEEEVPTSGDGGVPEPSGYDVEPAPAAAPMSGGATEISNYVAKLNEFADSMQNTAGESLQKLVTDIDRQGSLFMGITREVSSRIIKIASEAKDIATILDGFIINAAKRQRDIASGQQ